MRARIIALPIVAALIALLAGCGERNLIVNVDVLSYLDPSTTQVTFGPIPAFPGGISTNEVAVVEDAQVNMIERPNDFAKVQAVSLSITAQVVDSTGSGADTLRLYLSDSNTDPMSTPAVAVLPFTLTPGQTEDVHIDVTADQRVSTLFDGNVMRATITNSLRGPGSGASLNGRLQLTVIKATVIANRHNL